MSTILYFVTALVLTTKTPSMGWIQYTVPYESLEFCQQYIEYNKDSITLSINNYFNKYFVSIKKIECITREEAVDRNTKLGH